MSRSIYVPDIDIDLLRAMAKAERRSLHAQAAHLISEALERWRAEQALEASFEEEDMVA